MVGPPQVAITSRLGQVTRARMAQIMKLLNLETCAQSSVGSTGTSGGKSRPHRNPSCIRLPLRSIPELDTMVCQHCTRYDAESG